MSTSPSRTWRSRSEGAPPSESAGDTSTRSRPAESFSSFAAHGAASAVCAYSARARRDAGVSTPLEWDELGRDDLRARFTVLSVPRRLAKLTLDPWAEYASTRQSIGEAMWRALRA